jgi:predicted RecB family nuclease
MRIANGRLRLAATDLSNFLACRHLTRLDILASRGNISPITEFDVGFLKLLERGEAHEARIFDKLRKDGATVVAIPTNRELSEADKARATVDAMQSGVDVVYQGVLLGPSSDEVELLGRPDFLVRPELLRDVPGKAPKSSRYEVVDAKLARSAKARALLQIMFYSYLLTLIIGEVPQQAHLALGNGELATFRVANSAAYERRVRSYLGSFLLEDAGDYPSIEPYPEPVEHCAICRWRAACSEKRRVDDDLSLVAGMPTTQRIALKSVGVSRRTQFAELSELPNIDGFKTGSLERSQLQARLQVQSERADEILYELLDPDRDEGGSLVPHRGLLALPEPSPGDLFFDIEGARYYSEDGREFGLQYLFGIVDTAKCDASGAPCYVQIWAFDRTGEREAFEEFVDFVTERRTIHPDLHVYHYNHYEPTSVDHLSELHETREEAVGRLMGRFATREDEVDNLFRGGVFVDLYRVVRQSLRAGIESYSLKQLERMVGFERQVDLGDATEHLIDLESALDEGIAQECETTQQVVAGYNEDDCRATLALRAWLEERRVELQRRLGEPLPRPTVVMDDQIQTDPEVARLKAALTLGIPDDPAEMTDQDKARILLADLLEWHRREAKPAWWRYFRLREMSSSELIDEPDAIGGLVGGEQIGTEKRSIVRRFGFPPQEHGFDRGDRAEDPVSKKTWIVVGVDEQQGTIDLKIGKADAPFPTAIVETGPIDTHKLAERVRDLANQVVRSGFDEVGAAGALMLRRRPDPWAPQGKALRSDGETAGDAARRVVLGLGGSYLPVQGPPGAGKTYIAAEAIVDLVEQGRAVGVTGPSHAVIHNLLQCVVARAEERGHMVRIGQKADPEDRYLHEQAESLDYANLVTKMERRELDVVAGTAWLWARDEFTGSVDSLFVDEAGQLSLANTLAVVGAAVNLVLLGDPQQLAQPSQAAHPPGAGVSALGHVLGDHDTMPDAAGIFLDRTYRMHPDLCRYTSEIFYDDRLGGIPGLDRQRIDSESWPQLGAGLAFVEVDHSGNSSFSPEEAAEVVRLVGQLIRSVWTDRDGNERPMTVADVLVVTPFNAQVREIDHALAGAGISGVRVGTVDKFQGQEAPAVVYSMAASSAASAPRGLEFLFDLHRLNVATSRAKALAVIVANPDLLRVLCRTPRQIVLVNALCRAKEAAVSSAY